MELEAYTVLCIIYIGLVINDEIGFLDLLSQDSRSFNNSLIIFLHFSHVFSHAGDTLVSSDWFTDQSLAREYRYRHALFYCSTCWLVGDISPSQFIFRMKTLSSVYGIRGPSLSNVSSLTCVSSEFCLKWWCTHHDNAFYWLNHSSLHDYGIQLYHENSVDETLSPFMFSSGIWLVVQTRWSHLHRRGLETVRGLSLPPQVFVFFHFGVDGFRLASPWRSLVVDWLTKIVKFF